MDNIITPEPNLIPGYSGHCPQFRFRTGKTYGKLTHNLLVDPCVNHAPELIVSPFKEPNTIESPTKTECETLLRRSQNMDTVYNHPIIPGYDGFVPNMRTKVGKRFLANATTGVSEHEALMERLRCERRFLMHRDLLQSGNGRFEHKFGERLMPMSNYRAPLVPVRPRSNAIKKLDCSYKANGLPYSKFTVPHFMEDDDEEKWISNGYGGHIPMSGARFGESSKQLTKGALCEFTNNCHRRLKLNWCPLEKRGVGQMCPNSGQFVIYHRSFGMLPSYAGHVPGEAFTIGRTYGHATVDAKNWLTKHKDQ